MSNRTKQRRSGGLSLMLYQKALHPEFFKILATTKVARRAYEADVWIVEGGHVTTFTVGKLTLTEVVVNNHGPLNDRGLIQTVPCRGEKNHEMQLGEISYMISTSEEQMPQQLYDAYRQETLSYAARRELLTIEVPATADQPGLLSVLDIEPRSHELGVHGYHLFDENQMVIKTQGVIEVTRKP